MKIPQVRETVLQCGLAHRVSQLVMIGDPRQLGPIVSLQDVIWLAEGEKEKLEEAMLVSPFNWLFKRGRFCFLDTQYRMHSAIASFPSKEFYYEQLKTSLKQGDVVERSGEVGTVVCLKSSGLVEVHTEGLYGVEGGLRKTWPEVELLVRAPTFPWPDLSRPLVFINVDGREIRAGSSYCNQDEVEAVAAVVKRFFSANPLCLSRADLAVLTLYRGQVDKLKLAKMKVEVATIDSFQGRESAVVVVSTVRASNRLGA